MNLLPSREYLEALRENKPVLGEYSSELVETQQKLSKLLLELARQGVSDLSVHKSEYEFSVDTSYGGELMNGVYVPSKAWDEIKELLVAQGYELEYGQKDYYRLHF